MKKLVSIAIILLSCSLTNSHAGSSYSKMNDLNKFSTNLEKSKSLIQITAGDIIEYLELQGYTVNDTPAQYELDWLCNTTLKGVNYLTTVHTDGTNIVDHEDIRL